MIEYLVIAAAFGIIAYVYNLLKTSGFFSTIEPCVTKTPKHLSKPLTVYYKYHVGSYASSVSIINDAKEAVPAGATTFGIFYDNPDLVPAHLLQSAIGVVFAEDGKDLYTETHSQNLIDLGFEKMNLPKVEKAVQAVQPSTGGFLSILALVNRTYGIVKDYIAKERLEVKYAVEFYAEKEISIEFPLENISEFVVPDYLPTDQLEANLAKKKFDSDEEDSESEPDGEDVEDDGEKSE